MLSFIPDNYIENSYNSKYYTPQEFNNMFYSNPNDISLLHANLRSLNRNFEYFENLLHTLNNFKLLVLARHGYMKILQICLIYQIIS